MSTLRQLLDPSSWILTCVIAVFLALNYYYWELRRRAPTEGNHLGLSLLERILKLRNLKMFEIGISWLKGFNIKVEFFERKNE